MSIAMFEMILLEVEAHIKGVLGTSYTNTDWRSTFKAEKDSDTATNAVGHLVQAASYWTGLKICIPICQLPSTQLTALESKLNISLYELKTWNYIFGEPLSLDKLLELADKKNWRFFWVQVK